MTRSITGKADDLGDAMKELEMQEAGRKALRGIPLVARLDGRAFHTFTRGMARPFDIHFMEAMRSTAASLVKEFRPVVGYTQSDEISLVFLDPSVLFGGRFQKLHSVLAAHASALFARIAMANALRADRNWPHSLPTFDCRVWQVPDLDTALDALIWREDDATKNSVAMLAQAHFSHKELHCKDRHDMLDMLHAKGVNWNAQPTHFKRGIYIKNRVVHRPLTEEERSHIPAKHQPPPNTVVARGETFVVDLEPIRSLDRAVAIQKLLRPEPSPEAI
jgi:tRNA(His) 5'-end guanylyltransferase